MSMANSVEGRYPFLDDQLVNLMLKIDSKRLAMGVKSKSFLRSAFKNKIPDSILYRNKFAYQAPEAKSFANSLYKSDIFREFQKNLKNIEFLKSPHFKSLFNKILHPYTSDRLGFRENLSFLIGLSVYCLEKNSKKWITNEKK